MSDFSISYEDDVHNEMPISRYMDVTKFLDLIESDEIYLPTAHSYEGTDFSEGKFTESYERVIRNICNKYINDGLVEQHIQQSLEKIVSAREESYISCWTYREREDDKMWDIFGDERKGVLLRSNITKVYEQFDNFVQDAPGDESYDLINGKVLYDRENMHKYLLAERLHDFHFPFFFLDGGEVNFEHEQEIGFIVFDQFGADGVDIESLRVGDGTVIENIRKNFSNRATTQSRKHLRIPFMFSEGVLEVVFGTQMDTATRDKLISTLKEKHDFHNFKVSSI